MQSNLSLNRLALHLPRHKVQKVKEGKKKTLGRVDTRLLHDAKKKSRIKPAS